MAKCTSCSQHAILGQKGNRACKMRVFQRYGIDCMGLCFGERRNLKVENVLSPGAVLEQLMLVFDIKAMQLTSIG